jgi:hypothetical protein
MGETGRITTGRLWRVREYTGSALVFLQTTATTAAPHIQAAALAKSDEYAVYAIG